MNKEQLRKELEAQFNEHLEKKPDAVTLYAAERKTERRPWRKKPSLLDQAYTDALAEAETLANKQDS